MVAFIVDLVNVGLEVLRDGGDGVGTAAVHEPGHEIGAVAAEIEESAGAVELWIVEPGEKFGLHVNFCGAGVAVVYDDFANFADFILVDEIVGGAIAAVPGGFVIDEDVDVSAFRGGLHGVGVFVAHGERLFHHDGNFVIGAGFDDVAVVECVGVDEDGLRLGLVEHVLYVGEEKVWRETVFLRGEFGEFYVGFSDADDLDVGAALVGPEKAADVAVNEPGDGDAKWR